MGTSYCGTYVFGCLSASDDGAGWHEDTVAAIEAAGDSEDDFDGWVDSTLGMGPYQGPIEAWIAERQRRSMERWGCVLDHTWIGLIDWPAWIVHPAEAEVREWRGGRVPEWTPEQLATWKACMERVRADLPGLEEPGLYYGCSVG